MSTIRNPYGSGDDGAASRYAAVTASDTTDLAAGPCRALYVGTGGNVVAVTTAGTAVTFSNVPTGTLLPVIARRVNSTSTTASNIVALY
jgi:hypothetical protein